MADTMNHQAKATALALDWTLEALGVPPLRVPPERREDVSENDLCDDCGVNPMAEKRYTGYDALTGDEVCLYLCAECAADRDAHRPLTAREQSDVNAERYWDEDEAREILGFVDVPF